MNKRGFTLIESILTIVLMAVLGFMAAQRLSTSLRGSAESVAQVEALSEAVSGMEECIAFFNTEAMLDKTPSQRLAEAQAFAKGREMTAQAWTAPGCGTANVLVTVKRGAVELSRVF